jgi:hypothetical protein
MTIVKIFSKGRSAGLPRMAGNGLLVCALTGCIQVRAPDKPIEINLNVKVQQEVVVRLQQDAKELIQNNPELFPQ